MNNVFWFCIGIMCCSLSGDSRRTNTDNNKKGIIIAPVAELTGSPLAPAHLRKPIPVCGATPFQYSTCQRIHQALFNEQVTIQETKQGQCLIATDDIFFVTSNHPTKKQNSFWVDQAAVVPYEQLQQKGIPLTIIPAQNTKDAIIMLLWPYIDPGTQQIFSAGTQFVVKTTDDDNYVVDYVGSDLKRKTAAIPQAQCIRTTQDTTNAERKKLFVTILKQWANLNKGIIPYVLGGSSFTTLIGNHTFYAVDTKPGHSYFEIQDYHAHPKTGMDCSGLVWRAARMAGIHYFCKNTTTIEHQMPPVGTQEPLQEGDLILIPGHVMIISDLQNNLLIEARSYAHGYGKVLELPLSQVFKGIATYKDLKKANVNKETVYRIDREGKVRETIKNLRLIRMGDMV